MLNSSNGIKKFIPRSLWRANQCYERDAYIKGLQDAVMIFSDCHKKGLSVDQTVDEVLTVVEEAVNDFPDGY